MNKLILAAALSALGMMTTSCGTMYMDAPADSSVKLLPKDAPTTVRVEEKIWFKWWGSEPITHPHTDEIIAEHQLKEVRLLMTNTFGDGLCNVFPGMIGFPRRTLVIEGNPR